MISAQNITMKFDNFTGLCRDGCSHYNKSHTCPPNSPKYTDYTKDYESSFYVIHEHTAELEFLQ